MNLSHGDQTLWSVYIIIENLDAKSWQSQKWPRMLLLSFILIVYEGSEDTNNKNKNLKAKIYHMALKTMLQHIYTNIPFLSF